MNNGIYFVIGAVIIATGLIGAAFIFSGGMGGPAQVADNNQGAQGDNQPSQGGQGNNQPSVNIEDVDTEGEPFIGSQDAPVTMAYWFDYQCPFCKRFEQQTLSQLKKQYVDKGDLRIVFKDFAFLGPHSEQGALVSNAVWNTVKDSNSSAWFEFQSAALENQDGENSGWGSEEDMLALLENINGVTRAQVEQNLEQNRDQYKQEINADRQEGQQNGVQGTPGFVLEDRSISGAQPVQVFGQMIEEYLNK